ncbi:MAG: T9SS type A sorting domain-containing protein, partial [Chloroherpetonaceae bacterium]
VWDSGLFMSSDMGDHWININNDSAILHVSSRMVVDENIIFVGTAYGGVYLSTDMGNSWINESEELSSCMVFALAVKGDYIFASLDCIMVVLSTNMGNSWVVRKDGFAKPSFVNTFAILGDYIFAGTSGVYRAKISDLVLDVKEDDPAPVDIYFYPNPVSDYLYIDISAEFEPVQSIEIYDQLGRLLKNIPSNSLATHTLSIFVGDLSPSIYFLKIQKHGSYIYKKFIKI